MPVSRKTEADLNNGVMALPIIIPYPNLSSKKGERLVPGGAP